MTEIHIKEFTNVPGPRFRSEGPHSGEEFREEFLLPRFEEANNVGKPLVVYLDGMKFGYPTSFLEEAFGGLVRQLKLTDVTSVMKRLTLVSSEDPLLVREIENYIRNANKTSRERLAG